MSKTETTVLAIEIETAARRKAAECQGRIAACHRKTIAHLMPKFKTPAEADAYTLGFQETRAELAD